MSGPDPGQSAVRVNDQQDGGLPAFFALAFALAWLFWWAAMALPAPTADDTVRALLFLPGTLAPGVAALVLTARWHGSSGVSALLGRLFRWNVPLRLYAFALGYVVLVRLGAALAHWLIWGAWPLMWQEPFYVMIVAAAFSTPFQAGEELGWRGYALPRLAVRFGLPAASVLLGIIWAVWHFPLFFAGGAGTPGESFPLFVVAVTALSVAFAWLYWKSGGSLLLVMLLHAVSNNTRGILVSMPADAGRVFSFSASRIAWLVLAILWIGAAVLLVQMRRWRAGPVAFTPADEQIRAEGGRE